MTRAKAQAAAPAPAPVETEPVAASLPLEGDPTPPAQTDMEGLPSAIVAPAPEAPAGIHLRTTRGVNLVNPYTTQTITTAGVEVVRLDGWLDFQIESGKIERYTPEAAAE